MHGRCAWDAHVVAHAEAHSVIHSYHTWGGKRRRNPQLVAVSVTLLHLNPKLIQKIVPLLALSSSPSLARAARSLAILLLLAHAARIERVFYVGGASV